MTFWLKTNVGCWSGLVLVDQVKLKVYQSTTKGVHPQSDWGGNLWIFGLVVFLEFPPWLNITIFYTTWSWGDETFIPNKNPGWVGSSIVHLGDHNVPNVSWCNWDGGRWCVSPSEKGGTIKGWRDCSRNQKPMKPLFWTDIFVFFDDACMKHHLCFCKKRCWDGFPELPRLIVKANMTTSATMPSGHFWGAKELGHAMEMIREDWSTRIFSEPPNITKAELALKNRHFCGGFAWMYVEKSIVKRVYDI